MRKRLAALATAPLLAAALTAAPAHAATSNYVTNNTCISANGLSYLKITSWWDGDDKVYHFGWREETVTNGFGTDREWIWADSAQTDGFVQLIAEPSGASNPVDIYWRNSGSHASRYIDATWGHYSYGAKDATYHCPSPKPYL